jgi:enolase
MNKIKNILAVEVLDSKGYPAIETTVVLSNDISACSSPPSGTSKGTYEAHEIRDTGSKRYNGYGVLKAVENVNKIIAPKLLGIDINNQQKIDKLMIELDGTKDKSKLGANAILSVSQGVAKAGAKSAHLPLYLYLKKFVPKNKALIYPMLLFVLLEGGQHATSSIDFQEILLVPSSSKTLEEKIEIGTNIYHLLKNTLSQLGHSTLTAMEGGFAPNFSSNIEALELIKKVIENSNYKLSLDVSLGIDAAANSFYNKKLYSLKDRSKSYKKEDLIDLYQKLISEFSIIYLEDLFAEDDWISWQKGFKILSPHSLIVGDDLTVTNPNRLKLALNNNAINGIIIKPNQIGTISQTLEVVKMARLNNLKVIVSHRSGETMDDFIADFAIGVGADYVKFGAPARERVVKYNRLLKIKREIDQTV